MQALFGRLQPQGLAPVGALKCKTRRVDTLGQADTPPTLNSPSKGQKCFFPNHYGQNDLQPFLLGLLSSPHPLPLGPYRP